MHIHILGICGTFMGSLALLAREMGYRVTGADQHAYPPMSEQLKGSGIDMSEGYDPAQLASLDPDVVVIGNALSRGNPSVEYVLDQGLPYQSGPAWLAQHVLRDRWVLAVAGTHGKTTTASMLAWILSEAGMQPGYLIGGVPTNFGRSAQLGQGKYFVIEADEYDSAFFDKRSKFVHYCPQTLVLNNLEFDHADIFDDLSAIQRQFHHLIRTVPGTGKIILPSEPALAEVIDMGCWSHVEYLSGTQASWSATSSVDDDSEFQVTCKAGAGKEQGRVTWQLFGDHNKKNALAAIAAAQHVGVEIAVAAKALCEFKWVKRRMELLARINDVGVYDDFAHHPTAIKTTLEGVRARISNGRIIAVIEMRSNTMKMGVHNALLEDAIANADYVWWYDSTSQTPGDMSLEQIFADHASVMVRRQLDVVVDQVAAEVASGDEVIVMSNGGFGGIHQQLIDALQMKFSGTPETD